MNNEIRRECEKARNEWLKNECEEIEELEKVGRYDLMYERVREVSWLKKGSSGMMRTVKDRNGVDVVGQENMCKRWEEYVRELYASESDENVVGMEEMLDGEEYEFLMDEIEKSISEMKNKKAVGIDDIPIEFFKILNIQRNFAQYCMWPHRF